MEFPPEYIILDFETTDGDLERREIFEIGALRMRGLDVIEKFHVLVNPPKPVSATSARITGVTTEMLESEPALPEVLPEFIAFIGELPLVAHNAEFERDTVTKLIAPLVEPRNFTFHDTFDLLGLVYPDFPSLSEDYLRRAFGIQQDAPHRALNDCLDVVEILKRTAADCSGGRRKLAFVAQKVVVDNQPDWWWKWILPAADPVASLGSLHQDEETLGDLNALVDVDRERTVDWANVPPLSDSAEILRSHAREKIEGDIGITFQPRVQQEKMASLVQKGLLAGERISIEAPTGTGKSIAYLLPGMLTAEATGVPLVISTATKSLQDQLFRKDRVIVEKFLGGRESKIVTLKGQDNYVCLRKLYKQLDELLEFGLEVATLDEYWALAYVLNLAVVNKTAELSAVSWFFRRKNPFLVDLVERVKSHHTTTIGDGCPYFSVCRYHNAGRVAHSANVLIANHALVFNWPGHFPKIRNIIFDEAHHLEEKATDATTISTSEREIKEGLHEFSHVTKGKVAGTQNSIAKILDELSPEGTSSREKMAEMASRLRERFSTLSGLIPDAFRHIRFWSKFEEAVNVSDPVVSTDLRDALKEFHDSLYSLSDYLKQGLDSAKARFHTGHPDVSKIAQEYYKFSSYRFAISRALAEEDDNLVRLVHYNPEYGWRVSVEMIDITQNMKEQWESYHSVVLTSATLSAPGNNRFIPQRVGLALSRPPIVLPSPYDLPRQALLYFPTDISAKPGTPQHLPLLVDFTEQVARKIGGRTLLLICANNRVTEAASMLRERLEGNGIEVIDKQNPDAVEIFKATERAVLVGSEQHGEGIDIPGQGLSCVIIEKINESMTMKPLARMRESRVRYGVLNYTLPRRMMWLKQRIGRLVRSHSDKGWIVVFDPRFYGFGRASQDLVKQALAPLQIREFTCAQVLDEIEATKTSFLGQIETAEQISIE